MASPLLEASIDGAHGVLLSIQGGSNLGIFEINDAARLVQEAVHPEANIIFGAVIDDTLGDEVRVTVIAAGFDGGEPGAQAPALTAQPRAQASAPAESAAEPTPAPVVAPAAGSIWSSTPVAAPPRSPTRRSTTTSDLDIPDFLK